MAAVFVMLMSTAWLLAAGLDHERPILLYLAGFAFGLVVGRWWVSLLPVLIGVPVFAVLGLVELLGGPCALCSIWEGDQSHGALVLVMFLVVPLTMCVSAGTVIGRLARAGGQRLSQL